MKHDRRDIDNWLLLRNRFAWFVYERRKKKRNDRVYNTTATIAFMSDRYSLYLVLHNELQMQDESNRRMRYAVELKTNGFFSIEIGSYFNWQRSVTVRCWIERPGSDWILHKTDCHLLSSKTDFSIAVFVRILYCAIRRQQIKNGVLLAQVRN